MFPPSVFIRGVIKIEQLDTHEITTAITHVNAPKLMIAINSISPEKIEPTQSPLPQIYAGCEIFLQVSALCSEACDLQGGIIEILADDTVITQVELASFDNDNAVYQTDTFVLTAPTEPGEYTWTAVYKQKEEEEEEKASPHLLSSGLFTFIVNSHMITLSSWDVPFPVIAGSKLTLKVGARCAGGCKLAGEQIMLYNQQGELLTTGVLGDEPRKDTAGVYWTELELDAPVETGVYEWELRFSPPDRASAHDEASHTFVFRAARQPEHLLTIEVGNNQKIPVVNALVAITLEGAVYRARTDDAGIVSFNVPKGEYSLFITAEDHLPLDTEDKISVNSDQIVKKEMMYSFDSYK
jgi:hypothetical protein